MKILHSGVQLNGEVSLIKRGRGRGSEGRYVRERIGGRERIDWLDGYAGYALSNIQPYYLIKSDPSHIHSPFSQRPTFKTGLYYPAVNASDPASLISRTSRPSNATISWDFHTRNKQTQKQYIRKIKRSFKRFTAAFFNLIIVITPFSKTQVRHFDFWASKI